MEPLVGAAWIEDYDAAEDGRGVVQAWADHYNGQGELSKCTKLAKAKIESLYYKNKKALPFEDYSAELMHCLKSLRGILRSIYLNVRRLAL
jgi:hypothetical protein